LADPHIPVGLRSPQHNAKRRTRIALFEWGDELQRFVPLRVYRLSKENSR